MPGLGYDEQGSLATYFVLTFLSLVLIPSTLWSFKASISKKSPRKTGNEVVISSTKRKEQRERIFGRPKRKSKGVSKKTLLLLIGWAAFAGLSYKVATSEAVQNVLYNPFELLGISEALTDKEIKRAYKRLSLKFHPDKYKLVGNETREDADAKFVEITKAYKALTDDITRENWLTHGNPDGPQQREEVVAIPKWVIEGKNSGWILGVYGLVFGGLMPWLVGKWWFGTRQYTKDGALNASAALFFHRLEETSSVPEIITLLASSSELGQADKVVEGKALKSKKEVKAEAGGIEGLVKAKAAELGVEGVMSGRFESVQSRRSAAIIWSHLLRVEFEDVALKEERATLLLSLPPLLTSILNISLAHNWLSTSLTIMKLHALLIQATLPSLPKLLQLPHFTFTEAKAAEEKLKSLKGLGGVEAWSRISEKRRNEVLKAAGGVWGEDKEEVKETVQVAKSWPKLEILSARFKVVGEKTVSPSSIVQCVFKLRLTTTDAPPTSNGTISPSTDFDEDSDDDDVDDDDNGVKEAAKKVKENLRKLTPPVVAYSPYWPEDRALRYWATIGDIKSDRIIVQPLIVPNLVPGKIERFTMQFQAPQGPGLYTFQAVFVGNAVADAEVWKGMQLTVVEPAPSAAAQSEDEISDPDEDTIEGQLAQLKGGNVKSKRKGGDDDDEDESSEEESSSDEDGPKGKKGEESSDSDSD
ncbi:Sec63 Brl domain-containing protein [Mrakia frigida]|uniref:protein-transporting protein SEC63 n=1 Tax=Mrakia frigida TaxID=29902 RepID=UPI003FCBFB21